MLPHGEIIVRAPYGDWLGTIVTRKAARIGVIALVTQNVDEHAIATLGVKPVDCLVKNLIVIHVEFGPANKHLDGVFSANKRGGGKNPARTVRNKDLISAALPRW